ncbi:hypothetical protein C8J56DRAFT_1056261 [Mycena floridula]|nr:hypothetical protein C8J56DRAFT_1056261 [Mycena floridula]
MFFWSIPDENRTRIQIPFPARRMIAEMAFEPICFFSGIVSERPADPPDIAALISIFVGYSSLYKLPVIATGPRLDLGHVPLTRQNPRQRDLYSGL